MKQSNKFLSIIMALAISAATFGCSTPQVAPTPAPSSVSTAPQEENAIVVSLYSGQLGEMQYDVTFPLPIKSLDTSLSINNMKTFKGYKNQGQLYLIPTGVTSAEIFINGKKLETGDLLRESGKTLVADISGMTNNETNTIQVCNIEPADATIQIKIPYPTVMEGKPEDVGISAEKLSLLDTLIQKEIDYGFPGAQLAIIKDGVLIKNTAYGYINAYNPDGTPMENPVATTIDTMYDLASNTKMYSVNYALQKLVSEKKLDIKTKIVDIFPNFKDPAGAAITGKANLTVEDLLHHEAGFTPGPKFHIEDVDVDDKVEDGVNTIFSLDKATTKTAILEKLPLEYEPHTQATYSDVDYMLLGFIIEEITGQSLDAYVKESFYTPMGLDHITFAPLQNGFKKEDCAATELNGNSRDGVVSFKANRTGTIQAEVHDEKAFYAMGGISGHAGLFANANQLAKLCQVMLNGGGYGEHRFFEAKVIDQFTKPKDGNDSYGLGWRRNGPDVYEWAFGEQTANGTYGHTGWTGTLTVIDPEEDLVIVWLTNAKNSPVIDPKADKNLFYGDVFLSKCYGTIPTMVYESLIDSSVDSMDALFAQMVEDKENVLVAREKLRSKASDQSLYALADLVVTRAEETKSAENKARAEVAVTSLPDGAEKTAFTERLKKLA
ncbi:MAG: penicillin binding protein PBP4B [Angelakisella sp.]